MDELISQLMGGAGVDEKQAKGGAGLILGLAKDKLGSGDFSKLSGMVPGIGSLADEAPEGDGGGGGLMGAVGGFASGLGGGGGLGSLASLAGGFSSLGMDAGKVTSFLPIILSFVQNKGGDEAKGLLEGVLN